MHAHLRRLANARATWRVLTAGIAAGAALGGSYAYAGFSPSFVGDPVASLVVDLTPAAVVNTTLDLLGSLAQTVTLLVALALVTALLAGTVLACIELERLVDRPYLAVPLTALAVWLLAGVTTGAADAALAAALPAAAIVGIVEVAAARDPRSLRRNRTVNRSRRATLQTGFATLAMAGPAYVAGRQRTPDATEPFLDGGSEAPIGERTLLADAEAAAFDLPDAPGLVSEIGEFYTVDIDTIDPTVERDAWELSITGAVDSTLTMTYDDLRSRDADRFLSTIRCVGEGLNDREMDTAVWTGVPVAALLSEIDPDSTARAAVIRAVDDYWNPLSLTELERSYLVYGMNGRRLPRQHGHPVRLVVPGNWGEVNVKWIEEIELVDDSKGELDGYWDERGWDGTGEVRTVAKLWSIDREGETITLGGHAYAGRVGVDAVEVSTDGGDTWTDADLSAEITGDLGSEGLRASEGAGSEATRENRDVWRQWRYAFEPSREEHEVVVRAVDGEGETQPEERSDPRPDGPSGWVSETVRA